jgi:hypothetical protein
VESPIWTLVAGLFSGFVTFVVSTWVYMRRDRRKDKLALLREVMSNRHGLTPDGDTDARARFFQALNGAFAIFYDSRPVLEAVRDFRRHPSRAADNTTQLIRSMCKDLGIDTSFLEDAFFDEPFIAARGTRRNA